MIKKVKKVKDLTVEEIRSICTTHPFCHKCPLHNHIKCCYLDTNLERKVEIYESNNENN